MGKRGGTPAKAPLAKKEKISPDIMEIQGALKQVSHLPEEAAAMLAAVAPDSLGIAKENRDEDQVVVVQWIESTLEKRQAELVRDAEAALQKVRELESSKLQLQVDVERAEAALAEEKDKKLPVKKDALAESTIAMTTTKKMLAERQDEQRIGDADHVSKKQDLEEFEKVFEDDFKAPLAAGEALDHEKLQPFIAVLDAEDCFKASVASSCSKPKEQRSTFQAACLEELEKAFIVHREKLKALAEVGKPAADVRAAAVEKVEDELTKQRKVQEQARAELAEAQKNVETRAEELKAAQQAVSEYETKLEEISRVCQQSKAIQEEFEAGPLKTFRTCRDTAVATPICATAGA
jgi:chromosome segregation ATPase